MREVENIAVGQVVDFVFTTAGKGSARHRNYAQGEVVKIGSKLSIKVLDDPSAHEYWRKAHVGTIKVVIRLAVIPDLPEAIESPAAQCDCEDYARGLVSNECPVHNDNPRVYAPASGRSVIVPGT